MYVFKKLIIRKEAVKKKDVILLHCPKFSSFEYSVMFI